MAGIDRRLRVVVPVALVAIVAAVFFVWPRPSSPGDPASASATCPDFRLEIEVPRTNWHTTEMIDGSATFRYLGTGVGHWAGSGEGPVGFEYRQVDGKIDVGPVWTADLVVHDIAASSPLVTTFHKSGAYSGEDPLASFYAAFFADPYVRLPVGEWDLTAVTDHGCTDASPPLRATVRIHVVP